MDTIRSICIGISAHQKLELLSSLVKLLGYESLAVFGDCFDEASSLSLALWSEAVNVCALSCSVITSLLCMSAVMQARVGMQSMCELACCLIMCKASAYVAGPCQPHVGLLLQMAVSQAVLAWQPCVQI